MVINISIRTSTPLRRWQQCSQIMLDKGKGIFIENLRIIQLCEADLNFVLNIIWGKRLIQNAMKNKQRNESQYALSGVTCNSAVWNKLLYCDFLHQTISPGFMTDYDATAAFDRVLHAMAVITGKRLGIPDNANMFLFKLLQQMEFKVIT